MWIKTPKGDVFNTERVMFLSWAREDLYVQLDSISLLLEEDIPDEEQEKVLDRWMRRIYPNWNGDDDKLARSMANSWVEDAGLYD